MRALPLSLLVCLALAACANPTDVPAGTPGSGPRDVPAGTSPGPSAPVTGLPIPGDPGTPDAPDVPAGTSSAPVPAPPPPPPERPTTPQERDLAYGQTAQLRYFDVTALRQEFGRDGVSIGWKVRVCYAAPHPEAGADGRTRVSNNPWSVEFRDGEAGGPPVWRAISELPFDEGWVPEYRETRLAVGECQEGWLGVRHDNPDLQWIGLRYAPADFGDRITWR